MNRTPLLALVLAVVLAFACHGVPASYLVQLAEASKLTADLRLQFAKADDASNRAVMANTDAASMGFVHDAEQATRAVDKDISALTPLLQKLGYPQERQTLEQFRERFTKYVEVDRSILALAVENTNLKAQHLSFGPARIAADAVQASLVALLPLVSSKDRCRVQELADKTLLAVRERELLFAPHIAESDDAAMTRIEQKMAELQAVARNGLRELAELVAPDARASVAAAAAGLDRLDAIATELVALSRRNSNVRSLDLALRVKPPLTVACDDSLRTLQAVLLDEGTQPTR